MFNHFIDEKKLTDEELTKKIDDLQKKIIVASRMNSPSVYQLQTIFNQLTNERFERYDMSIYEQQTKGQESSNIICDEEIREDE